MKIIFIGTVKFSQTMLTTLIEEKAEIAGVITSKDRGINSDYADLSLTAQQHNIPSLTTDKINSKETINWVRQQAPDVIFCMGWSRLIKKELLQRAPMGVIGYHPAALPKNRGRHPLIWALVLGLKETASTFFFMDEGADSGDILNQQSIMINTADDATTLYAKTEQTAAKQIRGILKQLTEKIYTRTPQDHTEANSWRKRGVLDGQIDWRMSAENIHNLVRGLTHPYIGAHCIVNEQIYKIWKSKITLHKNINNIEPGKVIAVSNDTATVKCGKNAIELLVTEPQLKLSIGDYL